MTPVGTVAVNCDECPQGGGNRCRCEICAVCGYRKHMSVHGPYWRGETLIQEPWDHEFRLREPEPLPRKGES
jgi:hypothetical protein